MDTSLDRLLGPSWLAYSHPSAIENEHDQAMAAYFKATQLMKGCDLPLLYIGLGLGVELKSLISSSENTTHKSIHIMHQEWVYIYKSV